MISSVRFQGCCKFEGNNAFAAKAVTRNPEQPAATPTEKLFANDRMPQFMGTLNSGKKINYVA